MAHEIPQIQWDSIKGTTSDFPDAKYWIPSWRIKASSNCENGEYKLLDIAIAGIEPAKFTGGAYVYRINCAIQQKRSHN